MSANMADGVCGIVHPICSFARSFHFVHPYVHPVEFTLTYLQNVSTHLSFIH